MSRVWCGGLVILATAGVAQAQPVAEGTTPVVNEQHPAPASREREAGPWAEHPFAIEGLLGVATPVGAAGVGVDIAPVPALSLDAQFGSNFLGPQFAGMLRARLTPRRRGSFYVGAGYSQGRHQQTNVTQLGVFSIFLAPLASMGEANENRYTWHTARWANLELGGESRRGHFTVRGFGGLALQLNPAEYSFERDPDGTPSFTRKSWMLYAGCALGFAL